MRSWISRPLSTRGAWILFAIAAAIAAIVILWQYRGLSFFYDEWDFIQDRRGWGPNSFLLAHNEHFVAVPAFLFKVWFVVFGIASYWPYAVLAVVFHIACAAALFLLARSWSSNEAGLAAAIALMFMGTAFEVLMWPFEIQISLSLALGLTALLLLRSRSRRRDIAACALLVLAIASSTLAIPLVAAAIVLLLMQRSSWRRYWVVLIPLVLYGVWYVKYEHSTTQIGNARYITEFGSQQAAATLRALFGLPPEFGGALATAALILVVVALVRRWGDRQALVPILTALAAMWIFLTLSRYEIAPPDSSRYLYPAAILMLLAATAILARRSLTSVTTRAVIGALFAMALITNVSALQKHAAGWRDGSAQVRAAVGAMNEVRSIVPGSFKPQGHWAPQIAADKLFKAQDEYGAPADNPSEIMRASDAARASADTVLFTAGAIKVAPGNRPTNVPRPIAASVTGGSAAAGTPGCTTLTATPGTTVTAVVDVPQSSLLVHATRADALIRLARYSVLGPGDPIAKATPSGPNQIITPILRLSAPPWRAQITTGGTATLCRVK